MKPAFRIALVTGAAMSAGVASLSAQVVGPISGQAKPAEKQPEPATPPAAISDVPTLPVKESKPDIPALIKQLGDASAPARDEAERKLAYSGLTQEQLEEALQSPSSSAEQRVRLERLGAGVLRSTTRGALGVQFKMGELLIDRAYSGFDSHRVLKTDDQILSVDGHAVTTLEELRPAVIMRPPGAEVALKIVREGRTMTVKLTLGSFDELVGTNSMRDPLTNRQCKRAWELRSADLQEARRRAGIDKVLDLGLTPDAWRRATRGEPGARSSVLSWGDPTVVAAGQARNAGDDGRGRARLTIFGQDGAADGRGKAGNDPRVMNDDIARIVELQRKLAGGGLDAAARRKAEDELVEIMSRLAPDLDNAPRARRIP